MLTGIYTCFSKVLRRGPVQIWLVRRRSLEEAPPPLGERQNANVYNGFNKVLRRGPVLIWLVRRRRLEGAPPPPRRAPGCWYFQLFEQGFETRSRPDLVGATQAPPPRRAPESWYLH